MTRPPGPPRVGACGKADKPAASDAPAASAAPPWAVVITHKVTAWDTWKKAFDAHEDTRKEGGAIAHQINRHAGDPNKVTRRWRSATEPGPRPS